MALGGLQVAQLGDLTVERLEVAFRDPLMAAPAPVDDIQAKVGKIRTFDAVTGVAVVADRQGLGGTPRSGPVDADDELFEYAAMATSLSQSAKHFGPSISSADLKSTTEK